MNIVFRVDAALHIGSGHVMRCLTLADELAAQGYQCQFICRNFVGNLSGLITQKGYVCHLLSAVNATFVGEDNQIIPHQHWLGCDYQEDAEQTIAILRCIEGDIDWLIVDHYALDIRWETLVHSLFNNLMVIDDLADRRHNCELLLDQTYGRTHDSYRHLVPENCVLLLGAHYALLRSEFSYFRQKTLEKRDNITDIQHILVSMGGMDKDNCTKLVLDSLALSNLSVDCRITIVLGEHAPWLSNIIEMAAGFPYPVSVRTNVNNMAELMSDCDLAIGAGGTTTWERCTLGLPSIVIATAQNQSNIAEMLSSCGAHWYVGLYEQIDAMMLSHFIQHAFLDRRALSVLSHLSQHITDGKGASRVLKHLMKREVSFSFVTLDDAQSLYQWRNAPEIRQYAFNSSEIDFSTHYQWLQNRLAADNTILLLARIGGEAIGCIRFELCNDAAEISIYLSPSKLGLGYGQDIVKASQVWLHNHYPDINYIDAKVKDENIASKLIFERAGFTKYFSEYRFLMSC